MESISNIKDIFNNTPENKLQMFIEQYKDDSRQGVANLVKRAAKKIDDYNKEIERTYKLSEFERKYSCCKPYEKILSYKKERFVCKGY